MPDELIINTADLGLAAASASVTIFPCDIDGVRVCDVNTVDKIMVDRIRRTIPSTGTLTVPLARTALIEQAGTFYKAIIGGWEKVFEKSTGSESLIDAATPISPDPRTPALTLDGLDNVAGADTAPAGKILGATSTGEWGPVTVDAGDVGADPAGTAAALVGAEALLARDAGNLTSGSILDARIPSTITRDTELAQAVSDHSADTTGVHGIADTADLVLTDDARLSDVRAPRTSAVARWQRAQVGGRHAFQRARVLVMGDSYITIGFYNAVVAAIQETITGAESAFPGIAFTQPGEFTGGTTSQAGWNANAKMVAPGSPISVTFRLFAGAVVFFGAAPGGTLELYVAGVKVGETTTDTPGRLDVPSALAIAQTVELRAVGATIPIYGLWGSNTTPTSTSGVEILLSGVAGLGIHTVVANALTESIDFAEAYDPDLLIIGHFINSTAEQYEAAMTTFLTAFREVCPTTSIAIVIGPITDGRPFAATQRTTAYDLAELFDCYVVDTQEVLGDITGTDLTSDGVHLSTAGNHVFTERLIEGLALTSRPANHAASHADGGSDELALAGEQITSGTVADARIPSTIARDAEVTAAVSASASAFALFRTAR